MGFVSSFLFFFWRRRISPGKASSESRNAKQAAQVCVLVTFITARDRDLQVLGDLAFPSNRAAARRGAVLLGKCCFSTANEFVTRRREMLGEQDFKERSSNSIRFQGPKTQFHDGKPEAQIKQQSPMEEDELK